LSNKTLKTNQMEYVIFKQFKRLGGLFATPEEAKACATEKGIYNLCAVEPIDGRLVIISRESFVI